MPFSVSATSYCSSVDRSIVIMCGTRILTRAVNGVDPGNYSSKCSSKSMISKSGMCEAHEDFQMIIILTGLLQNISSQIQPNSFSVSAFSGYCCIAFAFAHIMLNGMHQVLACHKRPVRYQDGDLHCNNWILIDSSSKERDNPRPRIPNLRLPPNLSLLLCELMLLDKSHCL